MEPSLASSAIMCSTDEGSAFIRWPTHRLVSAYAPSSRVAATRASVLPAEDAFAPGAARGRSELVTILCEERGVPRTHSAFDRRVAFLRRADLAISSIARAGSMTMAITRHMVPMLLQAQR